VLSSGASNYAALHSRVRVMFGDLLTSQDVARFRESQEFPLLIALLKNTAYGSYLTGLDEKELQSRPVMQQVRKRAAVIFSTVIHSAPFVTRPIFIQLYRHFELENLKAVLRGLSAGKSWDQVLNLLFPFGNMASFSAERLFEAGTVEAAAVLTLHTPYHLAISQSLKRYSDEHSLFPMEAALDLDYWRKLWRLANSLPRTDQTQALRVLGPLMDLNNLMWALRYRIYHHFSEEEIINYTLPFGYHVGDEEIRAIASGADLSRLIRGLYPELPDVEITLANPEKGLPQLELKLQRRLRNHLAAIFTGYPFHIGLPLAYLVLLELELQDLMVLFEEKSALLGIEPAGAELLLGADFGELPGS
jgi:V/A-type H+/Na+-transporting ATPase subunit C